jgi:two-component system chemotaxis response regulator CheB
MDTIRDIIVIGGSEGSLEPLRAILAGSPKDMPVAILIVMHTGPSSPRLLASILATWSTMPVAYGKEGDCIEHGHVYLTPPDKHLEVVEPGSCI